MWKKVILSTLLVMFISSAFLLHQAMSDVPPDTTLRVEPQGTYAHARQSFAVDVTVTNVTDLFAWQFYMYYRSSVLNGTSITEGPFLITGSSTFFIIANFTDNYNATHGYMYISATRVGNVSGASGTGTLATVIFQAVGTGYSPLDLNMTKLLNSASPFGNLIPHAIVDGDVYVGSFDVSISDITAPPNIALGSMTPINVTAQNQGGFAETFDVTLYYNGTPIETKTVVKLPEAETQVLNFTWDTTPLSMGQYNLTARATVVPGETDLSDNTLSIIVFVGTVDLAITNVTPLKTVVGQGYSTPVNVTVRNQGQFSGTSNVTAYANKTVIAKVLNITLASGDSITLTFTWNTTAPTKGNFTIHAYVAPLSFELETLNNNYTSPSTVMVGIPGDIVPPFGKLDMRDVSYVGKRFGATPSAPQPPPLAWDPNADIDGTGKVDMKDIAIVAKGFGSHDP